MPGREGRVRLFLAFLVVVLVLVNSQSLQLSSQSRELLTASFEESFQAQARLVALDLMEKDWGTPEAALALARKASAHGLRSACILDWNARLLTGGGCEPPVGGAFDRLDRYGKRRLLELGWASTGIDAPYDVNAAQAIGYLALRNSGSEESRAVLRVAMAAPTIAEANRRFRVTLIYQVSALSLVLLAIVLFVQSLLAPHRRLVAEARSVATELSAGGPARAGDEGQFLLETFQEVVARLKEKEEQLQALHLLEKTRADETEALASDIIRSMTTGLVSLDPSGRVAVVNPAAQKIFELDIGSDHGAPFREAFSGSPELADMVEEALSRGAYHLRGQARYRLRNGRTLHLGVSVIPLLAPSGASKGALCLLADLTEVVELRERLFLKENLARLGEMAAGIAHEFRNGLATILGNAKLLKGSSSPPDGVADALIAESESLARVVGEFLQFAKPEPMHLDTVDAKALVSELLEEFRARAEVARVSLSLVGDPVFLEADELLLRKALSNLLANAIEAIAEAGMPRGSVVVEVGQAAGFALLRVRDTGPGIDREHRDRIFNPFFTLKESGTGLGLSVVQKIVVSHNGAVELEETASGASFLVRLPLSGAAPAGPQEWI